MNDVEHFKVLKKTVLSCGVFETASIKSKWVEYGYLVKDLKD